MCRYVMAEQMLGLVFEQLVLSERENISFAQLFRIKREVDRSVREVNDAIICMSTQELYQAVETYNSFFEVEESTVKLHRVFRDRMKQGNEEKMKVKETLQRYLSSSMPVDIQETVEDMLPDILLV